MSPSKVLFSSVAACTLAAALAACSPEEPTASDPAPSQSGSPAAPARTCDEDCLVAFADGDDRGRAPLANLILYARMDGSALGSGDIAMQKASVSAKAPWSTAQLGQMAFNPETGAPTSMAFVAGNILFAGGLPIMAADGTHLGGIGVSGGLPQQDEQCAQAGIDAVKAELT